MNRDDRKQGAQDPIEQRRSVTDSPWFWGLMFSGMAWVALTAMDQKFGRRQTQVEGSFKAREHIERKAAGRAPLATPEPAGADFDVDYSAPERTIISLGPLRIMAMIVMCVSAVALVRGRLPKKVMLEHGSTTTAPDQGIP